MGATSLAVLVLAVLPSLSIPVNPDDKLLHIAAFAVLALLAAGAFPQTRLRSLWFWLVGFAAAIEMIQLLMQQGREADWNDLMVGMSAAAVALFLVHLIRRAAPAASS
ncbi:VanZ family protein [Qipengyuania gaetbuli]|uniref:VanZ family protein n=1 Tax=Qipengyuania gaetbuli TaxID=266952 RepID=UPI001C9912F9|nr:VanZ family protein [Qipengyuania gaetbuli]MBY6016071.1 VanZ family protein [Qipengyuania gaetbuli]